MCIATLDYLSLIREKEKDGLRLWGPSPDFSMQYDVVSRNSQQQQQHQQKQRDKISLQPQHAHQVQVHTIIGE